MSYVNTLQQARILAGLSAEQLAAIMAESKVAVFQRDEIVFGENSLERDIYVVLEGEVAVLIDPARLGTIEPGSVELRIIRRLGPGESFGELAMVDAQPRTATIVATQPNTLLMIIPPRIFEQLTHAQIVLMNITRDITRELRASNTRMIESLLSGYYLTVLVEELATDTYDCSPISPLQKLVVIRSPESFILSGPGQLVTHIPHKEVSKSRFSRSRQCCNAWLDLGCHPAR